MLKKPSQDEQKLIDSSERGDLASVRYLLANDMNINCHKENGETSLHVASRKGHLNIVKELLDRGALLHMTDELGASSLHEASRHGHFDVVVELLDRGAILDSADEFGRTSLHLASENGHAEVVVELIKRGAKFDVTSKRDRTPLHEASSKGHLEVVSALLHQGIPSFTAGEFGWTALHEAAANGHLTVVQMLLDFGFDPHLIDNIGRTPLHVASVNGHLDVIKELINRGAFLHVTDEYSNTPLHYASRNGWLDVVKELIKRGAILDMMDEYSTTPLHEASRRGHLSVVKKLLIKRSHIDMTDKARFGRTPLQEASENGNLKVVKALILTGANLEIADMFGRTPLHEASRNGHQDVVMELLDGGAKLEILDKSGRSPLHEASDNGHLDVLKSLLDRGAKLDTTGRIGRAPLHEAAANGHLDVVKELLDRGAGHDMTGQNLSTPLHIASRNGHLEVVKVLLSRGASDFAQDKRGRTPLHEASGNGHLNVVHVLRERSDFLPIDMRGRSPLHEACANGHLNVVKDMLIVEKIDTADKFERTLLHEAARNGHVAIVKELLNRGALHHLQDKRGRAPLHEASSKGYLEVVNILLDRDATIDMPDKYGQTPLHHAADNGQSEIVKALLDRDAAIDLPDKYGRTPLHHASRNGYRDVVKKLVERGAAVDTRDDGGRTSLHFALESEHEEIVQILLDSGADMSLQTKEGKSPYDICNKSKKLTTVLDKRLELVRRCFGKNMVPNLAKNPKTAVFLADATLFAKFENIQRHPFKFNMHDSDVRINVALAELNKITSHDVSSVPETQFHSHAAACYSIHSAIQLIHQAIRAIRETRSNSVHSAMIILSLSLEFQVNRERILATGLMVGRIMHHMRQHGIPNQDSNFLQSLKDIEVYWQVALERTKQWKLSTKDSQRQASIQTMSKNIVRLQDRLCRAIAYLNIDLKIQVVGSVDDKTVGIESMLETMQSLDKCLQTIIAMSHVRQQSDNFEELAVQMERGFEHYKQQVDLGNIKQDEHFEGRVQSCQSQIGKVASVLSQAYSSRPSNMKIQSWMLSSKDVQFNPDDLSTALGRGGYATVFKGFYHGQAVAVKRFDQIMLHDSQDLEKLIVKEIKAWKDISHEPHILTLFGVCTKVPIPILVCELCKTNIRRFIRDWPETLIQMVYQFACGLLSLHKAGIIHRDLKGDNVLITCHNTVAIADFGLSRTVVSLQKTKTGSKRSGTLNWMSPEQYLTPQHVTTQSDVWSFGITLWEILCNATPYRDYGRCEIPAAIQSENDRPEKPVDLPPHLEPLWTLINMCWRVNPKTRPTAVEIVNFLEEHYKSDLKL
ncbi:hypothetical protein LEN26_011590 [Aphanomyces euteiches]|nr:hypothetical protein LEN26_011590 [Aphanomyces euteiches]